LAKANRTQGKLITALLTRSTTSDSWVS